MIVIILRQRFDLKCSTRKPALHRPTVDPCMECYNAHAQDFLAPDELPLLIQKSIRTVRPSRRYLSVGSSQNVRTSRYICRCQKLQSSSQLWPEVSRIAPDTPTPYGDHLVAFCPYVSVTTQ